MTQFSMLETGGAILFLLAIPVLAVTINVLRVKWDEFRLSQERIQNILDHVGEAIIMIDERGMIQSYNATANALFGYTVDEVLNRNISMLMPEPFRTQHDGYIQRYLKTGESDIMGIPRRITGQRKDRSLIEMELTATVLNVGKRVFFTGLIRDVTRQVMLEKELAQHREHLEELVAERTKELKVTRDEAQVANVVKSEFLANMSHEIRTSLNGVIGMTSVLLETELDEDQRAYTEVIELSGEALLGVINDILDFAKIEAGKLEMDLVDFYLPIVIQETVDILKSGAEQKGLELTYTVSDDVPCYVHGDPGRLRQILINLTNNAIKFTEKGEVTIRVERIGNLENQAILRFSVTDTGIGIPEYHRRVLFEAFTQADASTTRKYGGSGLGLAISQRLTELMGGEIGVESEAGGGSTFWFTAVFDEPPEFQRVKHRATQAALREKRVLIVDDIETNRQILCEYFTLWGCRHEAVSGGAEALAILEQAVEQGDPFQLAVFDMMMPDMNGEELGRAIKNDPLLATIQLILYTSRARRGDAEQMRDAGFDAYLIKPVTRSQLLDCLLLICGVEEGSKRLVTRHTLQEEVTQLRLNRSKIRILLAEDNITNQVVTDAILTKLGYHADFVANGREAVETLKETSYDLVLMDCQMPDVDGYAATRAIRSMEGESRHTPVIALTAGAMKGDRERCLDAGMDDYVAKPLDSTILAEVLDRWAGLGTGDTTPAAIRDADVFAREQVLDRFAGDEELLNEILKTFLEDVPQQIDALRETVNTGDATVYERNGHLLEGAASAVGALKIQRLGRQMELAGRNEDLSGAARAIEDVIKAFEEFRVIANGNTQGLGDAGEQSDSAT